MKKRLPHCTSENQKHCEHRKGNDEPMLGPDGRSMVCVSRENICCHCGIRTVRYLKPGSWGDDEGHGPYVEFVSIEPPKLHTAIEMPNGAGRA